MDRKKKTIKIEIYEDEETEFYGLIYAIKKGLKHDRWLKSHKRMMMDIDDDEVINPDSINKNIPEVELEYLRFLKYFLGMIHVPTIDREEPISWWNISAYYSVMPDDGRESIPIYLESVEEDLDELSLEEQVEKWKNGKWKAKEIVNEEKKDAYEDVEAFIYASKTIKSKLTNYKYGELINWIIFTGSHLKPKVIETDDFFDASMSLDTSILEVLPPTLNRGWFSDYNMFKIKVDNNYTFNKVIKDDAYFLIGKIFDNLKVNFSELREPEVQDYQLRIITGVVGSRMNIFKDEDTYLQKNKGKKTWRNYLADNVLNYLKKYKDRTTQK